MCVGTLDAETGHRELGLVFDCELLQRLCRGHEHAFVRLREGSDGRAGRPVQERVQLRFSELRLLVERDQTIVDARQFDDRLQDILLRDASGRVFGLCHVGELAQQIDAGVMNLDRLSCEKQLGIRALDTVHDVPRAHRDVGPRQLDVFLYDGLAQAALPWTRDILAHHEHVHVRVRGVQRMDRPLPDLRLEGRRGEEPFLSRAFPDGLELSPERDELRVPGQHLGERRIQRQRRSGVGG